MKVQRKRNLPQPSPPSHPRFFIGCFSLNFSFGTPCWSHLLGTSLVRKDYPPHDTSSRDESLWLISNDPNIAGENISTNQLAKFIGNFDHHNHFLNGWCEFRFLNCRGWWNVNLTWSSFFFRAVWKSVDLLKDSVEVLAISSQVQNVHRPPWNKRKILNSTPFTWDQLQFDPAWHILRWEITPCCELSPNLFFPSERRKSLQHK